YTIIGNEVNLAARLQSHAELGGIMVAHETSSLIKDAILTEEQEAISVKGFAQPVPAYRVVGIYDELEKDGRIIREERDGLRLLVDLTKGDQASAIAAVENVLARLKGVSVGAADDRCSHTHTKNGAGHGLGDPLAADPRLRTLLRRAGRRLASANEPPCAG